MIDTHLKVAIETWKPWFLITEQNNGTFAYSGVMWFVLQHLSSVMNFTYDMVRPPDGKWGVKSETGNWNGMIGMLDRGEVDIALGPFSVTETREEVCDFTQPVLIDYWTILMPVIKKKNLWAILAPFEASTWFALLFTISSFVMVLTLSLKIYHGKMYLEKVVKFVICSITAESSFWIPRQANFEMVMSSIWSVMVLVLVCAYSGNLVAMLAAPSFPIPINR